MLCIAVLCLSSANSQKTLHKTIVDSHVMSIVIDGENCYQLNLETSSSDELEINAKIEGEYSKDLVVHLENKGKSIWVSTGFQPNFVFPNDKLSAHKVISISLDVKIPEYKEVVVFGTSSNVFASGDYNKLTVKLSGGDCRLFEVGEEAEVTTQKGGIWLTTESGMVNAVSDYGKVYGQNFPKGNKLYVLRSKQGNIYLNKTK